MINLQVTGFKGSIVPEARTVAIGDVVEVVPGNIVYHKGEIYGTLEQFGSRYEYEVTGKSAS